MNNNCFNVELAETKEQQAQGLMGRKDLAQDSGIFFVYKEEGIYSFWMKDTLIPLDIIWINKNKEIIHIEKNAQPCKTEPCLRYGPEQKSKYVLEINAGLTEKLNINIGQKIEF